MDIEIILYGPKWLSKKIMTVWIGNLEWGVRKDSLDDVSLSVSQNLKKRLLF